MAQILRIAAACSGLRMTKLGNLLSRGRWYAARLGAMPAAEIPHRIAEARTRVLWRRRALGWQAFDSIGDGELADLTALRGRLARVDTFAAGATVRESVRRIRAGQFTFLGEVWPAVASGSDTLPQISPTFWFHDPITGKSWPAGPVSSFDVDVRATGTNFGDVKYVWEPNRLQMMHPLAAVIAGTQDRHLHQLGFAIIASWAAANPPYQGVNWNSGIELALRVVSLALFVAASDPTTLSVEERIRIRGLIVAHARYLAAFPSLYSSANNHRIAEGLGLFLAGLLLPDVREARAWRDEGRRILETETMRQILPDGVGAEQSPTYQAFSMEMVALAAQLADDLGVPFADNVIERLVRGAEYLSWLSDQNGCVPAIGDDDEGRVIAQPADREPRYVASIVAAVAGLSRNAALSVPAHDPHLRDVIFNSPRQPVGENSGLRVFEQGGVSVANETLLGRRMHLVFDHGPLGLPPLAAHGHADALAVWLSIDGEPVFIDAGTYRYFSGGETRSALREGLAHNTLVIDDLSPSRTATAFSWKTITNAKLIATDRGPAWSIVGEHGGYGRDFRVRHVRRLGRGERGFVIDDQLIGNRRPLRVTLRFLCDPGVSVARDGGDVVIGGSRGALCLVTPPKGFAVEITETLHSQRFGHLAPTAQIVFAGQLADDTATTHVEIVGQARPRVGVDDGEVIASGVQSGARVKAWH
jgi:uncharacterized heparinase superfamily protein